MSSDELWKARFAVKRAVLDLVANEYHEVDTADKCAYSDYLSDRLDEALNEYAEAYLMEKSGETPAEFQESFKPQSIVIQDPKPYLCSIEQFDYADALDRFFNRRAD